nr:phage major capsid protein [Actinomycetota bacterium]
EFGPVTFPAYGGATAGVRSLTDVYALNRFVREPDKLADLLATMRAEALPGPAAQPHSDEGTRQAKPASPAAVAAIPKQETIQMAEDMTVEERAARQTEIKARLASINAEYATGAFPKEVDQEWRKLNDELDENERVLVQIEARKARLLDIEQRDNNSIVDTQKPVPTRLAPGYVPPEQLNRMSHIDIYDFRDIRNKSRTPADEVRLTRDHAKRAIEVARYPGAADKAVAQTRADWLLDNVVEDRPGDLARRILATGNPVYDRAFGKWLNQSPMDTQEANVFAEARALSLTAGAGGNAVTFDLDPTIMGTSARAVNPWRGLARQISITGDEWRGVTSGAVTSSFAAEATETTDNSPTLTQPVISTEKAQSFIPFSIEIDMDWAGMRSEMSTLLQESKDDLEALKFTVGTGVNEPFGVVTGATTLVTATAGQTTDAEDFYRLSAALPERYQARASLVANRGIFNLVRQFVLTGQSNPWKDLEDATVVDGRVGTLLGYPAYMSSSMAANTATGALFAILGDFSRFVIVDRIGLSVEILPHLLGVNRRPTGERGLYAFWRVGSKVINADAFRVLQGVV